MNQNFHLCDITQSLDKQSNIDKNRLESINNDSFVEIEQQDSSAYENESQINVQKCDFSQSQAPSIEIAQNIPQSSSLIKPVLKMRSIIGPGLLASQIQIEQNSSGSRNQADISENSQDCIDDEEYQRLDASQPSPSIRSQSQKNNQSPQQINLQIPNSQILESRVSSFQIVQQEYSEKLDESFIASPEISYKNEILNQKIKIEEIKDQNNKKRKQNLIQIQQLDQDSDNEEKKQEIRKKLQMQSDPYLSSERLQIKGETFLLNIEDQSQASEIVSIKPVEANSESELKYNLKINSNEDYKRQIQLLKSEYSQSYDHIQVNPYQLKQPQDVFDQFLD